LKRKQANKKEKARDWHNYGINVDFVEFGKYYGFTLKEEPHFVLGNFSVTHNTTAGRLEIANELLQKDMLDNYQQYFQILSTGNLEVATENTQSELDLVRDENERLAEGKPVIAIQTDHHSMHIKEHRSVLSDSELRFDPNLVQRTLSHIQEHIDLLRMADPDLLAIIEEQPLSPPGGTPANQSQMMPPPPGNVPPMMGEEPMPPPSMPEMPTPPAPFEGMPIDPSQVPTE